MTFTLVSSLWYILVVGKIPRLNICCLTADDTDNSTPSHPSPTHPYISFNPSHPSQTPQLSSVTTPPPFIPHHLHPSSLYQPPPVIPHQLHPLIPATSSHPSSTPPPRTSHPLLFLTNSTPSYQPPLLIPHQLHPLISATPSHPSPTPPPHTSHPLSSLTNSTPLYQPPPLIPHQLHPLIQPPPLQ